MKRISKGQWIILLTIVVFVGIIISAIYLVKNRILYDPTSKTFGETPTSVEYLKTAEGYIPKYKKLPPPTPTIYSKYLGRAMDYGFISNSDKPGIGLVLWTLPVCEESGDFKSIPMLGKSPGKYFLKNTENINLTDLYFKPVKVWGIVTEIPEDPSTMRCGIGSCQLIPYKIMTVERIEIDNRPLTNCEQAYFKLCQISFPNDCVCSTFDVYCKR